MGRPLRVLRWRKEEYDDLQREYLDAVKKFFDAGFTTRDYLLTVIEAMRRKIKYESRRHSI